MKNLVRTGLLALLAAPLLLSSSCKKDEYSLEGAVPTSDFTYTLNTVGLTTTATFRATNLDGYLYQWNFGDGTTATGPTATHTYSSSGTVKAQLITIYRGGNSFSALKDVNLPSTSALVKDLLTGSTSKTWKLDNSAAAAIVVGPDDSNPTQYYAGGAAGSLPGCQADDEYTFSASNTFTYDAKGQTFVAGGACDAPRNVSTPFTFGNATGAGLAQITLNNATPRPFIGVTDAPDFVYRILSIDAQHMTLRAGSPTAGVVFTLKMIVK